MRGTITAATLLAALLGGAASVVSCEAPDRARAEAATLHRFVGTAMGCEIEITVDEPDAAKAREAARAAQLELDRIEEVLTDWRASSEVGKFNASQALRVAASADLRDVTRRALEVARASDGLFDPTVAPLVRLWRTARRAGGLAPEPALAEARACVGYRRLRVEGDALVRDDACVRLDFGGIGKGYGALKALEVLRANGCPRALVAVAGDIAAGDPPRGRVAWSVEIVPESASGQREVVEVSKAAVSTSGGSEQFVEIEGTRYAHIVDPRTGLGATALAQVTVVGPLDCSVDALGTALALAPDADAARRILAAFPATRARIERAGAARWIDAGAR
ncbi:MAG: FAD:protein FMN transferase [Planctomycetota bacterium]